jgi:hypothetical protein
MRRTAMLISVAVSACLGGPVEQAPACGQYVRCINALDAPLGQTTNLKRFEVGGVCWANGEISELCTTGCERALARLLERSTSLPEECTP